MKLFVKLIFATAFFVGVSAFGQDAPTFETYAPWLDSSLELRDYHIHIRGGMTPEMAVERARKTGVKSSAIENNGRFWPLSNNEKLDEFITSVEKVNATLEPSEKIKIGIQVNDRDWYKAIDPNLYARLDFVLADTMIMGSLPDGKENKLWLLPKDYDVDQDAWFEEYYRHCLTVVSEPIDILANVTYLPAFIADRYDELWTKERMAVLIQAAIDGDVALEIQAESAFPKPQFVELALKMGAKLSFGTNNFDTRLHSLATWKKNIEGFNLQKENLWRDFRDPTRNGADAVRHAPAKKRDLNVDEIVKRLQEKGVL